MAKFDAIATRPPRKQGTATGRLGPLDATEYLIAAIGSRVVKSVLRVV